MAGDEERLFVLLEARIADFEKKMATAERRGTQTYTRLKRDSAGATRAMETDMARGAGRINESLSLTSSRIGAVGAAFKGFLAGAAITGATMIIGQLGEIARGVAEIGDQAKRAGVSVQAFQEWKFVSEQNRIGIDAMTDGLKELSLRADEFVTTGGGFAAEAFQRLGYDAADLKEKLKDPSALLLEIIGRLGQLDQARSNPVPASCAGPSSRATWWRCARWTANGSRTSDAGRLSRAPVSPAGNSLPPSSTQYSDGTIALRL